MASSFLLPLPAAALAAVAASANAQGLPFEVEAYDGGELPLFVRPVEGRTMADLESFLPQGDTVQQTPHFYEVMPNPLQGIGELSRDRPEIDGGFIEVLLIERPEAEALQLVLSQIDLGEARLMLISLDTGQVQPFSNEQLLEAGQTALFFGTQLLQLRLVVPEGAEVPPLNSIVDQVVTYTSLEPEWVEGDEDEEQAGGPGDDDEEEVCGSDSRSFSSHPAVGRLLPKSCTAFLLEGGVAVTAGHCLRNTSELQNLVFNLPLTDPTTGVAPPPAIEDSYRLIPESVVCSDCEPPGLPHGSDWGVFRLAPNTATGLTAAQAQGATLAVPPDLLVRDGHLMIGGTTISDVVVAGYGHDLEPEGASYSQQAARGPLGSVTSTGPDHVLLAHGVDTEQGNSGSPIMLPTADGTAPAHVIGIHTGGTCRRDGNTGNAGTSFTLEPLRDAVAAVQASR